MTSNQPKSCINSCINRALTCALIALMQTGCATLADKWGYPALQRDLKNSRQIEYTGNTFAVKNAKSINSDTDFNLEIRRNLESRLQNVPKKWATMEMTQTPRVYFFPEKP